MPAAGAGSGHPCRVTATRPSRDGEPADGPSTTWFTPSKAELQAAYGAVVPDVVRPGTRVLLCGINPSLWSGAVAHHFANPSNRLWPTLHASGWTPRRLHPSETDAILDAGLGVTNLVARATARADELDDDELRAGLPLVGALAERYAVGWVAFLGLTAYRVATGDRTAEVGRVACRTGPARTWLLPNPSGLNASWQLPRLVEAYAALRAAALPGTGRAGDVVSSAAAQPRRSGPVR